MIKYFLMVLVCFSLVKVTAQDNDLLYGKHLLDSVRQLTPIDTADYSVDELIEVTEDFTIMHATVYYECNGGDTCFESRKGLLTSENDTLPPVFDDIIPLGNGELVLIGLQKVIHISAGMSIVKVYDGFEPMIEQLAVFIEKGLYGLLNETGEVLLPPNYTYIENNEDNHLILAQKNNKWEALDKNTLLKREKADEFGDLELVNTLLKVQHPKNFRWAFFSREAEQLTAYKYEDIKFTAYGDATASIDGQWGMINDKGEEATEFKYDEIRKGHGVTYIGVQGSFSKKYGLVSIEGELTSTKYSQITTSILYSDISKEYYWVAKEVNGHWGLLELRGQPLTDFIYDEVNIKDHDSPKGLTNGKWVELIK